MGELDPPGRAALAAAALLGALGGLSGPAGAFDPVQELLWLALLAPAAGVLVGASGVRLLPFGLAVPGVWCFLVVLADARSAQDLPTPLGGLAVLTGLYAGGLGAGSLLRRRPLSHSGLALLATIVAGALPVQGFLARADAPLARDDPAYAPGAAPRQRLARAALELSPIVLVLESSGVDWTHAHPRVYEASGVEWLPRRPWRGSLAGPTVLVVGLALGFLLSRRARSTARMGAAKRPARAPDTDLS